jgi:signal transduction histidine kinase
MADMVRLSEQFSGASRGRSTLIYLLEFLKQTGVDIHMYSLGALADGPYAGLVRKGMLGIRTTALGIEETETGAVLSIASVAPIERLTGIREVTVSSYPLDETWIGEFKKKLGVDITLLHRGRVITSTLSPEHCRQTLGGLLTEDLRERVLLQDESPIRDLRCGGNTTKTIFHPMKVNFRNEAVYALSVSLEDLLIAKQAIRTRIVLTAGLVLVAAVLIYSLLIRKITQPLSDLARLTSRVSARDFGARAEITARDEVGELGRSYNLMIERLERRQRELDELHQRELEQAHRLASIGELASSIAHEIRNPLGGISGAMEILSDDDELDGAKREILEEVVKQISRMEKLTKDLLDYAKPVVPELQPTDVNELLDRAIFVVELGKKAPQVEVERRYDPGLPKVDLDPEQVQQVFLNIMLNAIQAVGESGKIQVTTRRSDEGDQQGVFVEFRDNGPGMPPETLKKALRPFFTTKAKGTGLGLSIAREIMHGHGGSLELESEVGRGTRIALVFPPPAS